MKIDIAHDISYGITIDDNEIVDWCKMTRWMDIRVVLSQKSRAKVSLKWGEYST